MATVALKMSVHLTSLCHSPSSGVFYLLYLERCSLCFISLLRVLKHNKLTSDPLVTANKQIIKQMCLLADIRPQLLAEESDNKASVAAVQVVLTLRWTLRIGLMHTRQCLNNSATRF